MKSLMVGKINFCFNPQREGYKRNLCVSSYKKSSKFQSPKGRLQTLVKEKSTESKKSFNPQREGYKPFTKEVA